MRKSFDGLIKIVRNAMEEIPSSGSWFVFINKRKTQMKILHFDGSGYCIWAKRLEQGQFNYNRSLGQKQTLDWIQLKLIIDRLKIQTIRKYKRYNHNAAA